MRGCLNGLQFLPQGLLFGSCRLFDKTTLENE